MDSFSAGLGPTFMARGMASRDKPVMVFDWDLAAKIIKESGAKDASAGLCSDWEYTGGKILENGKIPEDSYTFLSSTWAKPELEINGHVQPCYRMQEDSPGWGADTFWPDSAKQILGLE